MSSLPPRDRRLQRSQRSYSAAAARAISNPIEVAFATVEVDDCKLPHVMFGVELMAACLFFYTIVFQIFDPRAAILTELTVPESRRMFGPLQYLTFHCVCIQFASSVLHICAHFAPKARGARNLIFLTLAFPLSMVVVGHFWSVYLVAGRELIYPAAFDKYFPGWLNHVSHTLPAPLNLLLTYLVYHRPSKFMLESSRISLGALATATHPMLYAALLYIIRFKTGDYVYAFLNKLNAFVAVVYVVTALLSSLVAYEFGKTLTRRFHVPRQFWSRHLWPESRVE